ncbi:MAG: hypothetical protein Kow006_02550 [Gammaproteobacteria bacterium]
MTAKVEGAMEAEIRGRALDDAGTFAPNRRKVGKRLEECIEGDNVFTRSGEGEALSDVLNR